MKEKNQEIIPYEEIMSATKVSEMIIPSDESIHAFALELFSEETA